ncbi:MAG: hypothetical protein II163_06295 [Ruminococcus sp.]|nr:hypothetical protein [Ruminococcus sp.]MBQ1898761.1 hypothetical protein [Ruminococcus sp.]MBQ4238110.1 hypothetical protein [Ruminococcus sp.]
MKKLKLFSLAWPIFIETALFMLLGSYLLAVVCGMGIYGMWIALAADECVRGILMLLRWKSGKWREKRVVQEPCPQPTVSAKQEN